MKAELHCHTTISDGSFSFDDLLLLAMGEQVSHLAITNHDTTIGLSDMIEKGKQNDIEIIPGIEISSYDVERERKVHILGYFIKPGHPAIQQLCDPLLAARHEACYQMVQRVIEAGYDISWEQVQKFASGGTGVYKQHIMHALIEKGYTESIYGELYKTLFSRGQNKAAVGIAYIPVEYVKPSLAIQVILEAGGVPVLAHPGQYKNFDAVPELVESGLQGIEVWHPLHSTADCEMAKRYAAKYGLIQTGGSDFHGFYGERDVTLGCNHPGTENLQVLLERKLKI
ncbi:PHP domain-containing protein [Ectobacillus polymachus]|uniref:PHP domain-containing protein n=1 Tax=Ectobacillus polymachus TaxID=1508806 RepID=UPI003A850886